MQMLCIRQHIPKTPQTHQARAGRNFKIPVLESKSYLSNVSGTLSRIEFRKYANTVSLLASTLLIISVQALESFPSNLQQVEVAISELGRGKIQEHIEVHSIRLTKPAVHDMGLHLMVLFQYWNAFCLKSATQQDRHACTFSTLPNIQGHYSTNKALMLSLHIRNSSKSWQENRSPHAELSFGAGLPWSFLLPSIPPYSRNPTEVKVMVCPARGDTVTCPEFVNLATWEASSLPQLNHDIQPWVTVT